MKCPFCAEEIKSEAIKCKHCGSMLNNAVGAKSVEKGIKTEKAKESVGVFMVLGLIMLSFLFGFTIHYSVGFIVFFIGLFGIFKFYWN